MKPKINWWPPVPKFVLMAQCPDCGKPHINLAGGPADDIVQAIVIALKLIESTEVDTDRFIITTNNEWDYSKVAILRMGEKTVETDWLINCPRSLCVKKMKAIPEERFIVACNRRGAMFNHNLTDMAKKAGAKGKSIGKFLRASLAPFRAGKGDK